MPQPIATSEFYSDGRGPELQRIIWRARGLGLQAVEYFNPDDPHDDDHLRHVIFHGVQVYCYTPEEVIGTGYDPFFERPRAAAIDCGQSPWFHTFDPKHLSRCSHYQLLFYDQLLDVICERVTFGRGAYSEATDVA